MILFGTQDAGPARYLAEVIENYQEECGYLAKGVSARILSETSGRRVTSLEHLTRSPSLIVTGTSLGRTSQSLDKQMVRFGNVCGIPTVSVVEHWTWMRERFLDGAKVLLPSAIVVNDDRAKALAIDSGLPSRILHPLGNPRLERLSKAPKISRKSACASGRGKAKALFVSESLGDIPTSGRGGQTALDEKLIAASVLEAMGKNFSFDIRPHPSESPDKYADLRSKYACGLHQGDIFGVPRDYDLVVGIASMLLVELAILGVPVVSYLPNGSYPFWGNEVGITHKVSRAEELRAISATTVLETAAVPDDLFAGSMSRVLSFLKAHSS